MTLTGLVKDMPEAEYHARPELSSTGARTLLDSPARFKHRLDHPIKGAALDLGTITHALVLGTPNPAQVIEGGRGKAEREREARAAGKIPVLAEDYAVAKGMRDAVLSHPMGREIFEHNGGDSEVSVFAEDPDTGVKVRARFDHLAIGSDSILTLAADLKTTAGSASPSGFGVSAAKYGYPIQEAFYMDTLRWAVGFEVPFYFVVVEKAPPHLVAVHTLPAEAVLYGQDLARKAREIYAECMATGDWPGYGDDALMTEIPGWWYMAADEDEEVELKLS